jgi:hypothetical protein
MARVNGSLEVRFWSKVDKDGPTLKPELGPCWLWTASCQPTGYGQIQRGVPRTMALAHIVSYELNVGPVPNGHELHHLCENEPCVNPAHLRPVTRAEHVHLSDTAAAINARKTHCPWGHAYAGLNLSIRGGQRRCRRCDRERQRERRAAA